MWKVLVVIFTLGNPCNMFVEDPMKYYNTEAECNIAAESKASSMMKTFTDFGYSIQSEAHACQYISDQKST